MTAVERSMEMMLIKQKDLPPLAFDFARHLCFEVGMCAETFITAFACYAQVVEGLPCDDNLYVVRPEHRAWIEERMKLQ